MLVIQQTLLLRDMTLHKLAYRIRIYISTGRVLWGKCTHGASVLFANNCLSILWMAQRIASVYSIFDYHMQTPRPSVIQDIGKIR
jgi:hypothetical protein